MSLRDPDLRRTWLFGPGADPAAHDAMLASGADALILDLEDFTPPASRPRARGLLSRFVAGCRQHGCISAIRINLLDGEGVADLEAAMAANPDVIAYPMTDRASQMQDLDRAISAWESKLGLAQVSTEILPVCETALGVVDVRVIVSGQPRIRSALVGSEDLATDLCAERGADAVELEYCRRRFVVECRAAKIEPIDAPYTFSDVEGAVREAAFARRLGYRSKSLVRPDHARALNQVFTPSPEAVRQAQALVDAFEAARERGEDRVLVNGHWAEVPSYRNARRLVERALRLSGKTD